MKDNRQIDQIDTKQVRIGIGLHRLLKIKTAKRNKTIKELLEAYIAEDHELINYDN